MSNCLLLSGAAIGGIIGGALALLLIVILIWYISTFNKLKRIKNVVDEGWATMDVQLKKRYAMVRHRLWGEERTFVLGIVLNEDGGEKFRYNGDEKFRYNEGEKLRYNGGERLSYNVGQKLWYRGDGVR